MEPIRRIAAFALVTVLTLVLTAAPASAQEQPPERPEPAGTFHKLTFESEIIGQEVAYEVYTPVGWDAERDEPYHLVTFLHGLGGNQTMFRQWRVGGLVDQAIENSELPATVWLMPDGKASFFLNKKDESYDFRDFFLKELLPHVEAEFNAGGDRERRALVGLSMGGYGALGTLAAHPDKFSAAAGMAPALPRVIDAEELTPFERGAFENGNLKGIFGTPIDPDFWRENNPLWVIGENPDRFEDTSLYFDCGDQDLFGFFQGCSKFSDILEEKGLHHTYHLIEGGGHTPQYFLSRVEPVLDWLGRAFDGEEVAGSTPDEDTPQNREDF